MSDIKKIKKIVKRAGRHFGFLKRAERHQKGAGRRALQKRPRKTLSTRDVEQKYNTIMERKTAKIDAFLRQKVPFMIRFALTIWSLDVGV